MTFLEIGLEKHNAVVEARNQMVSRLQDIADRNNWTTGEGIDTPPLKVTGFSPVPRLAHMAGWDEYEKIRHSGDEDLQEKIDDFIGHLNTAKRLDHDTEMAHVKSAFHTPKEIPQEELAEAAQAIMLSRSLLSYYRVTFNPASLKNWDAFSEIYQDLILAA